jgi:cation:H+ antiporter
MFLGLDGNYSRAEGITMIIVGVIFYIFIFSKSVNISGGPRDVDSKYRWRNVSFLILSLLLLLFGAYFTVESATELAHRLGVAPVLIGILIVGLGAVIPELAFSYKAVKDRQPSLAVGDIMGSVLAATTVVIGLLALIHPFDFPARITYVAGILMVVSSIILVFFIKSHYRIKRPEAVILLLIWLTYVLVEILV